MSHNEMNEKLDAQGQGTEGVEGRIEFRYTAVQCRFFLSFKHFSSRLFASQIL